MIRGLGSTAAACQTHTFRATGGSNSAEILRASNTCFATGSQRVSIMHLYIYIYIYIYMYVCMHACMHVGGQVGR